MIDVQSVRAKLAAVANGELSLGSFEEWIEPVSWNMHVDSSPAVIDLVSSIHLLMSERDHGDLSEAEYREALLALLDEEVDVIEVELVPPEYAGGEVSARSRSGLVQERTAERGRATSVTSDVVIDWAGAVVPVRDRQSSSILIDSVHPVEQRRALSTSQQIEVPPSRKIEAPRLEFQPA